MKSDREKADSSLEVRITDEVLGLLRQVGAGEIKKVIKGESLKRSHFKGVLAWYKSAIPWIIVTPDLILVWDDHLRQPDETLIVAVEVKYFGSYRKSRWRKAFREIGQPLRDLAFGFNSVVLWHIFSEKVDDGEIRGFIGVVDEILSWLKLPVVYVATKKSGSKFKIYKPWDIDEYQGIEHLGSSFRSLAEGNRNPLLGMSAVGERRKAIKMSLGIP